MVNTQLNLNSAYHPQTDGQTKVVNRSLRNLLRCLVGDHVKAWDQNLCQAEFAHNYVVNRSTRFSPFQVVYSAQQRRPLDLMFLPISGCVPKKLDFEAGDFVWAVLTKDHFPVGEYNKLLAKKISPLEIVEKINSNAYRLKLPSHIHCFDVFNVKHLLPYYGDSSDDDLVVNSRAKFVYPRGNDAGPSIEERAILFLEAQDCLVSRAEVFVHVHPKRNRPLTEACEQEFEHHVMARMDERLDQFVDQLANQMNDMMNLRRRRDCNSRGSEGEELENPFFDGDEVFEFKDVTENKRVSLIAPKLRGRASTWWQQLKLIRGRVGKLRVTKSDDQLVSRYIGGLRVHIMDSVNMFDPVTLSEKQNRWVGSSSSPSIIGGSSGSGSVTSRFVPNQTKVGGGNIGPVSKGVGSSGLKCFNCGEPDHRQSQCKKARKRHISIDEECEDNGVANDDYEEPLVFDDHQYEEEIVSGDVGVNLMVRRSCLTPKAAGDDWLKHSIFQSTCTILGKITLMPNKPKELVNKPTGTSLTLLQFHDELEMGNVVFVLIRKEVAKDSKIPVAMIPLLEEFSNVFPDELLDGLPPLRDIQHNIDLDPGS
ncbi:putative reverse transcriptase domain-containing protein [Tanacetum coccineum]